MASVQPYDWFPTDAPLTTGEDMALWLLDTHGPHKMGAVESEEDFAAAFTFTHLVKRGMVMSAIGDDGPTYHMTPKGRAYLAGKPA